MYGSSLPSELSTSTITPYVTTFCCKTGVEADLRDLAGKGPVAVGVHREGDRLSDLDVADVGLVHGRPHQHVAEVLGQQEQAGRIHAGHHRLADVHAAVDHHAVDGRGDGGVAQVDLGLLGGDLRLIELGLGHGQFRVGHVVLRFGLFEFGRGIRVAQLLGAAEGAFRQLLPCAAVVNVRLGKPQLDAGLRPTRPW